MLVSNIDSDTGLRKIQHVAMPCKADQLSHLGALERKVIAVPRAPEQGLFERTKTTGSPSVITLSLLVYTISYETWRIMRRHFLETML